MVNSFFPKELDLDRLHAACSIIDNPDFERDQIGLSVAYVEKMLNEIELGDAGNQYLYVAPFDAFADTVKTTFVIEAMSRFGCENISYDETSKTVAVDGRTFSFIGFNDVSNIRGFSFDRIFLDLQQHIIDSVFRDEQITKLMVSLYQNLSFDGDVV